MAVSIVNIGLRGFQFLFAIIILGLSVSLIKDHRWGSLPATLDFIAFVAAVSVLGSLVGLAGAFVEFLQGPIGLIADAVVLIVNLIGGVLMAIKMQGVSCNSSDLGNLDKLAHIEIINGGWVKLDKQDEGAYWPLNRVRSNCRSAQADFVFMFLTVALVAAVALLTFLRMRKGY